MYNDAPLSLVTCNGRAAPLSASCCYDIDSYHTGYLEMQLLCSSAENGMRHPGVRSEVQDRESADRQYCIFAKNMKNTHLNIRCFVGNRRRPDSTVLL